MPDKISHKLYDIKLLENVKFLNIHKDADIFPYPH